MPQELTNNKSAPRLAANDSCRLLLDNTRHFLGLLDLNGGVLEVNQSMAELRGLAPRQLVGRAIWEAFAGPPRDRSRLRRAVSQAAIGEHVNYEMQVVRADGQRIIVDISIQPIRDDQGTIVFIISEGHDVTLRKGAESDLEQQRVFLQAVLDTISEGIAACDAEGVLTLFNPASRAFHNLLEFPVPEADWAEHDDLYQPDGLTPLTAEEVPLYRALRGEVIQDAEMVIAPEGGKRRRLLASAQPLASPDGSLLGAVVATHDVTETRSVEVALREQEEHWRRVIHALSEGIVQQDNKGQIVICNMAAERILGLTQAQLLERDNLDPRWRIVDEDGAPFPCESHPAMTALRTGEPLEGVVMGVHKVSGALTWLLTSSHPLWRLGEAEPYAVVSSFTDITGFKETEAQLRYASQHDALTGLPTATLFRTRLEQAVTYAARDPATRFAVLYIDLDGFKTVNDVLGHSIGDNLLVTVARQLERCVRGDDIVARLGGDEFAVLLGHLIHTDDAIKLAERVLRDLAISLSVAGRVVNVSASVGVVLSDKERCARDLLDAADHAMYEAKAAGKARYFVFKQVSP